MLAGKADYRVCKISFWIWFLQMTKIHEKFPREENYNLQNLLYYKKKSSTALQTANTSLFTPWQPVHPEIY